MQCVSACDGVFALVNIVVPPKRPTFCSRSALSVLRRKPERGLNFMMEKNFVGSSPQEVAHFLFTRKGLSRRMIGEYLGLLNNRFAQLVLE